MDKFRKYKSLKNKLDIKYKGIALNRVMAVEIWLLLNEKKLLSFKRIFYFFVSLNLNKLDTSKNTFSTLGPYNRNDYKELYQNVTKKIGEEVHITYNDLNNYKKKLKIRPLLILRYIGLIVPKLKGTDFTFFEKLIVCARFIYYINIIEDLQKVNFNNVNKYLAFSGVHDIENLLTQFLSNKNIVTYSLQHGISFLFEKDIPIDSICYENFESDFLLCWGQYTIDQYSRYGIPKTKLKLAGYPKAEKCIEAKKNNEYKKGLVLLTRTAYDKANIKLLDICRIASSKTNLNFSLKLHPSLTVDIYKKYILESQGSINILDNNKTLMFYLDNNKYDFVIAVNTSGYYEALIKGIPSIRYNDGSFDSMYGMEDEFSSVQELLELRDRMKKEEHNVFRKKVHSVLTYALGMNYDNYKEILTSEI